MFFYANPLCRPFAIHMHSKYLYPFPLQFDAHVLVSFRGGRLSIVTKVNITCFSYVARVCVKGVNVFLKVLETVSCAVYFYRFELRCWVTRPITHGLVLYAFLLMLYFVLLGLPCQPGIAWISLRRESPMRDSPHETGLCMCL